MRTAVFVGICLLMVAGCVDSELNDSVGRLDGGGDAGDRDMLDASNDGGPLDTSAEFCLDKLCKDGVSTAVPPVCFVAGYGQGSKPSAAIYDVCLVSPSGELYLTRKRGDQIVTTPGWTHSGYSNGLVRSTLRSTDEARCTAAMAAPRDAGAGVCQL